MLLKEILVCWRQVGRSAHATELMQLSCCIVKVIDPLGGTSGMPRSFWHAFSKSLVAVSISPVSWHNFSWATDSAMRCSAACSTVLFVLVGLLLVWCLAFLVVTS